MDSAFNFADVHYYRVRLGHNVVRVRSHSPGEAVREARRQMAREMPRLWDVIQSADASRFEVSEEANG